MRNQERGIFATGGAAVVLMVLMFVGMIIALLNGEPGPAAALGISLLISIIWTGIATAVNARKEPRSFL